MPVFDFRCQKCGHQFDKLVSNAGKDLVRCPMCSSGDVKQLISQFNTRGGLPSCEGFNPSSTG